MPYSVSKSAIKNELRFAFCRKRIDEISGRWFAIFSHIVFYRPFHFIHYIALLLYYQEKCFPVNHNCSIIDLVTSNAWIFLRLSPQRSLKEDMMNISDAIEFFKNRHLTTLKRNTNMRYLLIFNKLRTYFDGRAVESITPDSIGQFVESFTAGFSKGTRHLRYAQAMAFF